MNDEVAPAQYMEQLSLKGWAQLAVDEMQLLELFRVWAEEDLPQLLQ